MTPEQKQIANATVFTIGMIAVYFTTKHAQRKAAPKLKEEKERMDAKRREADKFVKNLPLIFEPYRRRLIDAEFWKIVNHEE